MGQQEQEQVAGAGMAPGLVRFCLQLLLLHSSLASPFRGWGPGEGYGNAGRRPPTENPNAKFGYDYFGTTHNRFNYSAIMMRHEEHEMMHDAKHVAVAPRVAEHRHHHGHNHGAEEEVPVFVPSDQRQQKGMEMNQRRRPKSEGKAQNRHKGSPTKLFRSDKGDHGRGRLRNRTKSVPVRSKSVSETRGRSSVRRRKPALKAAAFDRRLKAAASEGQFSGLRRRARKSKQEAVHLTAGDLWSLNRSAKSFQELRDRGRNERKGRRFRSWSERRHGGQQS